MLGFGNGLGHGAVRRMAAAADAGAGPRAFLWRVQGSETTDVEHKDSSVEVRGKYQSINSFHCSDPAVWRWSEFRTAFRQASTTALV